MKRTGITPLAQITGRAPEAGRIRLGVKAGKAMKSIDTFRFTSPDKRIIDQIASLYGGTAKPWNDPKANPPNQFEVITTTNAIPVLLVPDGLSTWYEAWTAGGVARRCDGEVCQVPQKVGYDYEMVDQPCICAADKQRICEPYTRLNVVLPAIHFIGVWRLETKGWNAVEELPGMFNLIAALAQQGNLVPAELSIDQRTKTTVAGKRNFVVPRLSVRANIAEMATGVAIGTGTTDAPALMAGTAPALDAAPEEDITDAEIVDDELLALEEKLRADAINFGLDPEAYIGAILRRTERDYAKIQLTIDAVRAGKFIPINIANGTVVWKKEGTPS